MQENEFEKHLKKMMDGFHISPSNSVWDKVSRRLNEKRRRKVPFFFLLVAGIITAALGSYYIYQQDHQNKNIALADKNANAKSSNLFKDSGNIATQKNNTAENNVNSSTDNKSTQLQYDKTLYRKESVPVNDKKSDFVIKEKITADQKIIIHPQKDNGTSSQGNNEESTAEDNNSHLNNQSLITVNPVIIHPQTAVTNDENTQTKEPSHTQANANNFTQNNLEPNSQTSSNDATKKAKTSTKLKTYSVPKWQFGFAAFYGKSNLTGDLPEIEKSPSGFLNFNPGMMRISDTASVNQHPFSPSNAYTFGITAQRKILRNASISAGINFIHLSVKASVNKKINSAYVVQPSNTISNFYAVDNYYQAGQSTTYTSKYNFIELPVNFQQHFFHSKQTSLSYNAGFSVRQLISSDALIYNASSNIYFSKDDLLRKTQFQLNGGLNFEIKTGKTSSVFVGPQISYSLSNYLKNADNGNFHFINYGVQAGFLLHKK